MRPSVSSAGAGSPRPVVSGFGRCSRAVTCRQALLAGPRRCGPLAAWAAPARVPAPTRQEPDPCCPRHSSLPSFLPQAPSAPPSSPRSRRCTASSISSGWPSRPTGNAWPGWRQWPRRMAHQATCEPSASPTGPARRPCVSPPPSDGSAHEEDEPVFSPDGGRVAFLSDAEASGQPQLYVADLKSGAVRQLTHVTRLPGEPALGARREAARRPVPRGSSGRAGPAGPECPRDRRHRLGRP